MQLLYDPRDDAYHERLGSQILYWLDDLGRRRSMRQTPKPKVTSSPAPDHPGLPSACGDRSHIRDRPRSVSRCSGWTACCGPWTKPASASRRPAPGRCRGRPVAGRLIFRCSCGRRSRRGKRAVSSRKFPRPGSWRPRRPNCGGPLAGTRSSWPRVVGPGPSGRGALWPRPPRSSHLVVDGVPSAWSSLHASRIAPKGFPPSPATLATLTRSGGGSGVGIRSRLVVATSARGPTAPGGSSRRARQLPGTGHEAVSRRQRAAVGEEPISWPMWWVDRCDARRFQFRPSSRTRTMTPAAYFTPTGSTNTAN